MSGTLDMREVCVDGLVILRIMKHARQAFPVSVYGTLLGLEDAGLAEVTNCFGEPLVGYEDVGHTTAFMKGLKEVNADFNYVGWYTTTYLGSYLTKETVELHAAYQQELPNAILLVYDAVSTSQGLLSLKALRLSEQFMEEYKSQLRLGSEAFTKLAPSAVFEELPLRVRNPHLIQAWLADMIESKSLSGLGPLGVALPGGARGAQGVGGAPRGERSAAMLASGVRGSIAASVGSAVGATPAAVMAAEQETDFARLDLATGAWPPPPPYLS
jgi:hypothetical protein